MKRTLSLSSAPTRNSTPSAPHGTPGANLSFTCDDTALPDAAFPYVIDPTYTTSNSDWYMGPSPIEQTGSSIGSQNSYFSWQAQYHYELPDNAQIDSENVDTSGLNISVQSDPSMPSANCSQGSTFAGNGWVTVNFTLSYNGDGRTYGCIASVTGSLS